MTTINDIPPELLAVIFRYVERYRFRFKFVEGQFPFNVAHVCNLWLDILKSCPRYWKDIYIDLANDPTPFLDTFALCNRTKPHAPLSIQALSIEVYSSIPIDSDTDNEQNRTRVMLEGERSRKLFKHLEFSLWRYKSVKFELRYQSSLPPATRFLTLNLPLLEHLSLGCIYHNLDDDEILLNTSLLKFPLFNTFSNLVSLSLTGRSFMELRLLGTEWLEGFKRELSADFKLSVTHFTFTEFAMGGLKKNRAITTFAEMLCDTSHVLEDINLSNLYVEFNPLPKYTSKHQILTSKISFNDVSSNFIKAFFACCDLHEVGAKTDLIFTECEIPYIPRLICFPKSLTLMFIPTENNNESLRQAILRFLTGEITFSCCEGFNDDLLDWLSRVPSADDPVSVDYLPSYHMHTLNIEDCSEFTVAALRSFVTARAGTTIFNEDESNPPVDDTASDISDMVPLQCVSVTGCCPPLSLADAEWFKDSETNSSWFIIWEVDSEGVDGEGFITSLDSY